MTRTTDPLTSRPAGQLRADARLNRSRLLAAATEAFAERGADAPLEDIARRAGVGIGTLYRHFPTRLDLQAAVFRSQVEAVCGQADALMAGPTSEQAFAGWLRALAAYLVSKRGLSKALIDGLGMDSELMKSCSVAMRDATARLLSHAQQVGVVRRDVDPLDVMRLVHGVVVSAEKAPDQVDRLLGFVLDGLSRPAGSGPAGSGPVSKASEGGAAGQNSGGRFS
jgi:AcrR family transcriptional regulator